MIHPALPNHALLSDPCSSAVVSIDLARHRLVSLADRARAATHRSLARYDCRSSVTNSGIHSRRLHVFPRGYIDYGDFVLDFDLPTLCRSARRSITSISTSPTVCSHLTPGLAVDSDRSSLDGQPTRSITTY
jgi:hypothetical protein